MSTTNVSISALIDIEGTSVTLCPRGDHLRAARRWQSQCGGCGQRIPTGDVGPLTGDDEHRCGTGEYSHQHGCGTSIAPTEVTRVLAEPLTAADVGAVLDDLDLTISWRRDQAAQALTERLREELSDTLQQLIWTEAEADDLGLTGNKRAKWVQAQMTTGSDSHPGVYLDEYGRWVAWDFDPRRDDDEDSAPGTIAIYQDDLARDAW